MEKRKMKKSKPGATATVGTAATEVVSRYSRVQQILDHAAGQSEADYGGLGRQFWNTLKLDDLLIASLEGVRLIAPEKQPVASCCSSNKAAAEAGSRADRSGLVQGLRGLPPFDGSRLPRLMWGGSAVSEEDIQFIADWINDGCPAGDLGQPLKSFTLTESPISIVREGYALYDGPPNQYKYQQGELKQRMNLDCLSPDQLEELRCAFRELYELNNWPRDVRSYNNLALVHQNHCQHGWERFLPWHRVYLYEFEQALQDHCPNVTMPYWDWVMPKYPKNPIPDSFQMFLTEDSLKFLKTHKPVIKPDKLLMLEDMVGKLYPTIAGFFADVAKRIGDPYTKGEHRKRFIDALLAANSLWYPLRYPGQFATTINEQIHYHYPSPVDIQHILSLRTFRDFGGGSLYNDSFGFLDQNPHNTMHIWTGGFNPIKAPAGVEDRNRAVNLNDRKFHQRDDMYREQSYGDMLSNLTASYDPIFWPIHANVDRLWSEWQQSHPDSNPADLDSALSPWTYTIRDTLDMNRFGYEYVKSAHVVPVGSGSPVGRFVSRPMPISDSVRTAFQQAEVRLHRVPQLPRSCFVRVFLNLPDANTQTPLTSDHYAGYLAIFGHGECYGGPGHCDLPPQRPRPFDLRGRHHNTPRNHRVNVTACAKRLLGKGASTLSITLVVIGADYVEDKELLRLEGVSLNFMD
ncbi:MAG TPA: tyrosinase family protein [Candidatus Angelobacter sp.]|nr:tyrosinase family protein [Candidatus Angelobacter sp.]